MAEGHDWTTTVHERCPYCGYDAASIDIGTFDAMLTFEAMAWQTFLGSTDDDVLRHRPSATTWSALEYACHIRDLLSVFAGRVDAIREGHPEAVTWWDHEAAAVDDRYNEQMAVSVAEQIGVNAAVLAASFVDIEGDGWNKSAERRPGETFTIAGLVRFALHETFHHRDDAMRAIAST